MIGSECVQFFVKMVKMVRSTVCQQLQLLHDVLTAHGFFGMGPFSKRCRYSVKDADDLLRCSCPMRHWTGTRIHRSKLTEPQHRRLVDCRQKVRVNPVCTEFPTGAAVALSIAVVSGAGGDADDLSHDTFLVTCLLVFRMQANHGHLHTIMVIGVFFDVGAAELPRRSRCEVASASWGSLILRFVPSCTICWAYHYFCTRGRASISKKRRIWFVQLTSPIHQTRAQQDFVE